MATQLDLEEQEQLENIKHFWKQYGSLITWVVILVLAAFAGWNGWNWWQRDQAVKASALYDEVDKAAQGNSADQALRAFNDLKDRYPRTVFAAQAGLLAAKVLHDQDKSEEARTALAWVSDHASQDAYGAIARLRLAGLLLDQKAYDDALKRLSGSMPKEFEALAADRRGDVYLAQGQQAEAQAEYEKAYKGMPATAEYRRLVEAKLTALGKAPAPETPASEVTQ
ncbi:tetratricopeptide repeat protein [Schlegelella sp. S2-27]|uniref:Ancillary SecYEG translocon subunit n=1 Tax=Caldimonas mangrovi TaxID=2944811 RepID=A0ABT0YQJ5_9BURK|nr:tetratricopeptide repeat protein [Caldimonas mangrovi]MCM5681009.1 tetratricopeptide repeat protein [Caldimonas mangrovi]